MKLKKLLNKFYYEQDFKVIDNKTDKVLNNGDWSKLDKELLNSKVFEIITVPETNPDTIVIYVMRELEKIKVVNQLEQPEKCLYFKNTICGYPIEDCYNCPNYGVYVEKLKEKKRRLKYGIKSDDN